ncbi:MAG: hypothetical protein ACTHLE_01955 [Agriterribacter sp.]
MNFNSKDILPGDWLTVAGQPENGDEEVSANDIVIIKKGAAVTGKIVEHSALNRKAKGANRFVIHSFQARDSSSIHVRLERFRSKVQNDNESAMHKAGSLFTIEFG